MYLALVSKETLMTKMSWKQFRSFDSKGAAQSAEVVVRTLLLALLRRVVMMISPSITLRATQTTFEIIHVPTVPKFAKKHNFCM